MVMDPNFKKILEQTNINNNKELSLKEIKQRLELNISYSKIKQILNLIYGNDLKEIHKKDKRYYNIMVTRKPIKTLDNIMFWELYNKEYIKNNYNNINDYFNIKHYTSEYNKRMKRAINTISMNIIYFCLCSGVPKNAIPQILINASYKANQKQINTIYNKKRNDFKKLNNRCGICGCTTNLELHHIEPLSHSIALKYNPDNWFIVCSECHKKIHKNIIDLKGVLGK